MPVSGGGSKMLTMSHAPRVPVNRIALVVGADSEIGSEASRRLALDGCQVIGLGSDPHRLHRIAREVTEVNGSFAFYIGDLTNPAFVRQTLMDMYARYRGIHFVMNALNGASQAFGTAFDVFYRQRLNAGSMSIRLESVVDCLDLTASPRLPTPLALLSGVAYHRVYIDEQATAVHANLVAAEILELLMAACSVPNDLQVRLAGEEVIATYTSHSSRVEPDASEVLGPTASVYVGETDHGRGVYAGRGFRRGDLILKTTGKVVPHQTEHSIQIGWRAHLEVDAPVRYLNHACEPNAGIRTNSEEYPDVVAFRDIRAGEEIRFDYGMTEYRHYDRRNPELEFSLECRCGSPACRGRLGYYSELSEAIRQAYTGFIADYLTQPAPPDA